jgi:hypothetical protein
MFLRSKTSTLPSNIWTSSAFISSPEYYTVPHRIYGENDFFPGSLCRVVHLSHALPHVLA